MGSPLHHDVIQVVNKNCKQLIMLSVDKAPSVVSVSIFETICLMIIENICTSEPLVLPTIGHKVKPLLPDFSIQHKINNPQIRWVIMSSCCETDYEDIMNKTSSQSGRGLISW